MDKFHQYLTVTCRLYDSDSVLLFHFIFIQERYKNMHEIDNNSTDASKKFE